jgi:hypothetical protein
VAVLCICSLLFAEVGGQVKVVERGLLLGSGAGGPVAQWDSVCMSIMR